jgi:hypothetical protein
MGGDEINTGGDEMIQTGADETAISTNLPASGEGTPDSTLADGSQDAGHGDLSSLGFDDVDLATLGHLGWNKDNLTARMAAIGADAAKAEFGGLINTMAAAMGRFQPPAQGQPANAQDAGTAQNAGANQPPQGQTPPNAAAQAPAGNNAAPVFDQKKIESLRASYGDELVDGVVAPLMSQIQSMQAVISEIQPAIQAMQMRPAMEASNKAFSELGGDFKAVYGDSWDSLTPEQQQNRQTVLGIANSIYNTLKGKVDGITPARALKYAHQSARLDVSKSTAISEVRSTIKSRAAQRVIPPTAGRGGVGGQGGDPDADAKNHVRNFLKNR